MAITGLAAGSATRIDLHTARFGAEDHFTKAQVVQRQEVAGQD